MGRVLPHMGELNTADLPDRSVPGAATPRGPGGSDPVPPVRSSAGEMMLKAGRGVIPVVKEREGKGGQSRGLGDGPGVSGEQTEVGSAPGVEQGGRKGERGRGGPRVACVFNSAGAEEPRVSERESPGTREEG